VSEGILVESITYNFVCMHGSVKDKFVRRNGAHIQFENLEQNLHHVYVQHDDFQILLLLLVG